MAKLEKYDVKINGVDHTLKLSAEDAERLGVTASKQKAQQPANKSGTAANK